MRMRLLKLDLRPLVIWLMAVATAATTVPATLAADSPEPLNPPVRYLVASPRAFILAGEEKIAETPQGSLLLATQTRGPWRYIPEFQGWMHLADLVPVEEAVAKYTAQIEAEPTAAAHHLRGIAWMARGEHQKAAQDLLKAYDLGESAVSLHFNLSVCYRAMNLPEDALRELDSILKNFPDEFRARIARGTLLLDLDQPEPALTDLTEACRIRPNSAEAWNHRGVALRLLERYDAAITAYTTALEHDPKLADALANRAFAQKMQGRFAAARDDYEAALKIDSNAAELQNDAAWFLATCPDASLRNPERAMQLAEAAWNKSQKQDPEYLDTLAAAYAAAGKFEAAVEAARLVEQMWADQPELLEETVARRQLYEAKKPYIEMRDGVAKPD